MVNIMGDLSRQYYDFQVTKEDYQTHDGLQK